MLAGEIIMQKSLNDYPTDWPEIAIRVKELAGWRCERCAADHDPRTGYTLTVHHLDMDKSNCAWWNLAALCQRCHLTIQGKVIMSRVWMFPHTPWFVPHVAGYYAHVLGLSDERSWVLENADTLIRVGQGLGNAKLEQAEKLEAI
jgi:hypothetical protein